jgi:tetratricopeptide (TPR) repeat protein
MARIPTSSSPRLTPRDGLAALAGSAPVLVGRAAELRELRDAALRAAAERRGWVGLVGGEPGIGKTRLAAACTAELAESGFGFAWVSCPEGGGTPPFWAWDQLLGQLGAGDALRAEAGEADPELARFQLFDAVATAIRTAAADRPLLLVIDDLHWADPASRRLLAAIRGVLATRPAVALCTYRDTEPGTDELCAEVGPDRHLVLGGLAPADLAAAVELATGSAVPDGLVAGLHARTAGNPYFAAEAIRLLRAEGRLDTSAELPGELLPGTVRAVLERRLARLPAPTTELLRVAALLGDDLDPPLLAEIAAEPLDAVALALAAARAARVTGGDRFAHPLVREVLHAQLGPADQLRWHARIGAVLAGRHRAGTAGPAPAARHLLAAAAAGGEAGPALEFARLAAADAVRRLGYEDAVQLLSAALALAGPGERRGELLCALGEAALAAGDRDRARAAYAQATELARRTGQAEPLAAAALGMAGGPGGFEIDLRDPNRVALLTEALRAQPEGDSRARAALLGRLSLALAFTGATPRQREALSTRAVEMARRLGDPAVLAAALAARCDAISGPDHVAERRAAATEIIKLARAGRDRTGEMLGRRLLVVALAEAAEWSAVDAEIDSYARQADYLAQPGLTWCVPLWRGARALMRGDHAAADTRAGELARLAEQAGSVNARLLGLVQRYVRLMSQGQADELAADFADIVGLIPDDPRAAVCAQAFLHAHRGQLAEARADLDRVVAGAVPRDGEWLPKFAQVAVAAVLADHRAAAELAYRLLEPYAGQCAVEGILAGSWGSVAAHLGLLARYLGRTKEAGAHFARAAELDAAAGAAIAARTRDWASGDGATPDGAAAFRLDGEIWTLSYAGRTVRLRDSKGLRDLAVLVTRPGERTHVSELAGAARLPGSDTGPMIDRRALAAYRERLRHIAAELDSLDAGAPEAETLSREREALLAELSATTGLGGRPRTAGSPAERMRKAVTYRIRHAIARVAGAHPELGRHLQASVRTGTWCSYAPEHRVDWRG